MSDGPLFLLAVNSPIYAPIVLAKILKLNGLDSAELEIADPPRPWPQRVWSKRPPQHVSRVSILVHRVLAPHDSGERTIIGVGDPMRLAALGPDEESFAQPRLIGSLISKMCYWILHDVPDHDVGVGGAEWDRFFAAVVAHPKGMSGYSVPLYDLLTRGIEKKEAEKRVFGKDTDPNAEFDLYSHVRRQYCWRHVWRGRSQLPPAFITTNPLHAWRARTVGTRFQIVKAYPKTPGFNNVVMTAMFVSDQRFAASRSEMEAIRSAVVRAAKLIVDWPEMAAIQIADAFVRDKKLIGGAAPCFGLNGPKELTECLKQLVEAKVYNMDSELSADTDAIHQSLEIHRVVRPSLQNEFVEFRSINEMRDLFSAIERKSPSLPAEIATLVETQGT